MKSHDTIIAFARAALGLPSDAKAELEAFGGRGSDRTYFRFRWNSRDSVIIVSYQTDRMENSYFADIAGFLLENDIPVPRIIRHDGAACLIAMEDLGDTDLWSLRDAPWEIRRNLYQKTLTIVHRLHSYPEPLFPSSRVRLMDGFGPDLYRWERHYFRDNFLGLICNLKLDPGLEQGLESELAALAERLVQDRRSLVHRDLQSQNVMIYEQNPFLIDFQGMRFGTRFYDLGSLLCDPYVALSESERMELLSFYYQQSNHELDWSRFQILFWEASAQRLMQALGAYGFLGIARGLRNYLAHVPAGLTNLGAAAERAGSLPKLLEICRECIKLLEIRNPKSEISNLESRIR